jgi:ABC-type multidrug transport system fused ATPase/permease subunit
MQLLSTFSTVIGTIGLVFYTFPYLGIIFLPLGILYYVVSIFYRRTSVETKRLDSLMRSALYASYSETLTGLATVRAYHEQVSIYALHIRIFVANLAKARYRVGS